MNQLNLIRILSPFDPRNHTRETVSFKPGASLSAVVPDVVMGMALPWAVTLNGKVIDQQERESTFPENGDYVTMCPMPQGGDDGDSGTKTILRIIAIAIISYYTLGAGSGWATVGEFSAGAGWGAAAFVAGTVVVNALLPPPKPKLTSMSEEQQSSSYGYDGPKNTSLEGISVPVCYGEFRMGGNILSNYVVNDGDTQLLYMLFCAGEGPVNGLTGIEINDQPVSEFQDAEVVADRLGTSSQEPIPWFATNVTPQSLGQQFLNSWTTVNIGSPVTDIYDRLRIDIVAPQGLFKVNNRGGNDGVQVTVEFEYKAIGSSGDWQILTFSDAVSSYIPDTVWMPGFEPTPASYDNVGGIYYETRDSDSIESTRTILVRAGYIDYVAEFGFANFVQLNGSERKPFRRSVTTGPLPQGAYQIRFRRIDIPSTSENVSDKVYIGDVNKIVNEVVGYKNTAILGVKVRLNEKISSLPTVTYLNGGKLVKVWNKATSSFNLKASSNPAWITFDILTNKRYGGGASESRIDLPKWIEWADWCDEQILDFNGVFDTQSNVWDAANAVARAGRGQILMIGTRYSVVIERADSPSMMFSVANMIAGTFQESWSNMDARANEIEVTFSDREDKYKPRTVRVYDKSALTGGEPQRTASVDGRGIVSQERAYDEALLMLNMNRHIQRSIEFAAPIEAIACSVGDLILVQHDMPQWGYGGRLEADSTSTTLKLDRPISMVGGSSYQALVHADSLVRLTSTVSLIIGDVVYITGYDGATNVKRAQVAGKDLQILSIFDTTGGSNYGVQVLSVDGISVGNTIDLIDTNVLVTRNVVNSLPEERVADFTEITLAGSLGFAPPLYSKWMFGETNKTAKPFRVMSISGSTEYRRDIRAIEYNETIYDGDNGAPTINYSALDSGLVQHVALDAVVEEHEYLTPLAEDYTTRAVLSFRSSQETYSDSLIYLSRNDGTFSLVGRARNDFKVDAVIGDSLVFKVVAQDSKGNSAGFKYAPTVSHVVVGKTGTSSVVTGFTRTFTEDGVLFGWDSPSDWLRTEVRSGIASGWNTNTIKFSGRSSFYLAPLETTVTTLLTGKRKRCVRHFNLAGEASVVILEDEYDVEAPLIPTFEAAERRGGSVTIRWDDCKTTQPIKEYRVRVATPDEFAVWPTYSSLSNYVVVPANTRFTTLTFDAVGTRRIWVQAVDVGGIVGDPDFVEVEITADVSTDVTLNTSSYIFAVDKVGAFSPATITFTAIPTGDIASSTATWTTSPSVTLTGSGNTRTLAYADFSGNNVQVTVSYTLGANTYTDRVTLFKISDGYDGDAGDALTMVLSNEAHLIPCNASGTPLFGAFGGASTAVKIYKGVADDTANWTLSLATTDVTASASGSGASKTVTVSAISADSGYVDISASRASYPTLVKRFSLSKAKQGDTGSTGSEGPPGANAVNAYLTNEAHTLPADSGGAVTGGFSSATGTFKVFNGTTEVSDSASFSVVLPQTGCTGSISDKGVYSVTAMSADSAQLSMRASYGGNNYDRTFSLSKAKAGAPGADGTTYWLTSTAGTIQKNATGVLNPSTITFSALSKLGSGAPGAYAGRLRIETSVDGNTFTTAYTSSSNQSSYTYSVSGTAKFIRASLFLAGGTTVQIDQLGVPVVLDGVPSTNSTTVSLYQWASATPDNPTTSSTYTWSSGSLSAYSGANGWQVSIPTNPNIPGWRLYAAQKQVTDVATNATSAVDWTFGVTIRAVSANGLDGSAGANAKILVLNASSQIFRVTQDGASDPTSITFSATSQNLAGTPNFTIAAGSVTALAGSGSSRTLAFASMLSDSVTVQVTQDGLADTITVVKVREGSDSYNLVLSNDAHTLPAGSTGGATSYFGAESYLTIFRGGIDDTTNWSVGSVDNNLDSVRSLTKGGAPNGSGRWWRVSNMPNSSGNVTITATKSGITLIGVFSAALSRTGETGANGVRTAFATVYQWQPTIPTPPAGSGTYTWATATFTGVPSGWTAEPGAAPSGGYTLWAAAVPLIDSSASSTTSINWTLASITARGYSGTNGSTGSSYRVAYAKTSLSTLGTGTVTTGGNSSFPPDTSFGASGWAGSPYTLTAGESLFQSDGIYNPATTQTVWQAPYLSSLKVGSLSAITINTGSLTANGDITVASGGSVRSSNYSAGSAGYILSPTTAEFPAASIRGQLTASQINTSGLSVNWSSITGSDRPADNATVGATWGANVTGQPTSLGGINSTEGLKLTGIEASATVGATSSQAAAIAAATTAITNIASDFVLSRGEKSDLILEWDKINGEVNLLLNQASALGITAEYTAYNNAYIAAANYLTSLSPAWNDTSQDTNITPATFRQTFVNVVSARAQLVNKMAAVASTTASWSGVSGVPAAIASATPNQVFRSASTPTGTVYVGAVWYKQINGNTGSIWTWDGSSWIMQQRGPVVASASGGAWSDATAASAIAARGAGAAQAGDVVTISNGSFASTKMLNATGDGWVEVVAAINGNLVVNGSITADKIYATSLSALTSNVGVLSINSGGNITIQNGGSIRGGAFTGFAWPSGNQGGFYLGPEGLLLGNYNSGNYIQANNNGDLYSRQFTLIGGNATFSGNLSAASGSFSGAVYGGGMTAAYAWPATANASGFHLSSVGLLLGDARNNGGVELGAAGNYMFIGSSATGNFIRWQSGQFTINNAVISSPIVTNPTFDAFAATISPNYSSVSLPNGSNYTAATRTVSVTGGKTPYTYYWTVDPDYTYTSGAISISGSGNSATIKSSGNNISSYAYVTCIVTDGNGRSASAFCLIQISHGNPGTIP